MGLAGTQKAVMYALGGLARGGATRGGYVSGRAFVFVDGSEVSGDQIERGSVEIEDALNETPNTCRFRVEGFVPNRGDEVIMTLGSKNRLTRLFAGHVLRPKTVYIARGAIGSEVNATDYTAQLRRIIVRGHYVAVSATAILLDLYAAAPGYATTRVQTGLPIIDEITITNQPLDEATTAVMKAIGGHWDCDYQRVIHAFLDDEPFEVSPRALDFTHPTLEEFTHDPDDSQRVTRCLVQGKAARVLSDVAPGATTIPIESGDAFDPGGGSAVTGAQRITYGGVTSTGGAPSAPTAALGYYDGAQALAVSTTSFIGGSPPPTCQIDTATPHGLIVGDTVVITGNGLDANGPRIVASVVSSTRFTFSRTAIGAPAGASGGWLRKCLHATSIQTRGSITTVTFSSAHGFTVGQQFKIQFSSSPYPYQGWHVVETIPSSTTLTFTMSGHPADASAGYDDGAGGHTMVAAVIQGSSGSLTGTYSYKQSATADGAETLASAASGSVSPAVVPSLSASVSLSPSSGGSLTNPTNYYYGFSAVTDEGETDVTAISVTVNLAGGQNRVVLGLPWAWFNDPRVKAINVWRTSAGNPQLISLLRFVGTLASPTSGSTEATGSAGGIGYNDDLADLSRGGPVPTLNTTGGATIVSGLAISANARTNQRTVYRNATGGTVYRAVHSVSNNVDTGVIDAASDTAQANGAGEPTTAGTAVLTGIPASGPGSIVDAITAGDEIALVVQTDDPTQQTAIASAYTTPTYTDDGVRSDWIEDSRLSIEEATARGTAALELSSQGIQAVNYQVRDPNTKAGRTVHVGLGSPVNVTGDFKIQRVTISEVATAISDDGVVPPLYQTEASNELFSTEDLIRQHRGRI